MKYLTIEKIEKPYAIARDKEQNYFALEITELPAEATVGSTIAIDDDGVITMDSGENAIKFHAEKEKLAAFLGE
ncbi:MAG: hypothetical protein R3Y35_06975 [Clostridia bacterium]